jgi:two-component system response regulator NreC
MGCGLSNDQIAEKTGLRATTLQGHRRNIMGKLNVHTTPELIRYAVEKGFSKIKSFH